ncbi:acyl-CoA desaturase [Streptomyces sp. GESEQ-4]|uniref:acyl-CoA desaturase n=1 Tax=Streptomyces sp. GESEQ-4 TaxID=2812655 RepID=UPI001FF09E79|nr:acyl-CoA desaturase [Streptomyces sp. GESEQ-4]
MPRSPTTPTTASPSAPAPPQGYDGTSPFPRHGPAPPRNGGERLSERLYVTVTAVSVVLPFLPFLAIGLAGRLLWGSGFHRGLTHGGYIALAVAGSLSFQGDVITWAATPRRHHAFTDRPSDPHSPYRYGTHLRGQLRGLLHAHVGRLLHGVTALLWAGLVRVALLHHVTWSVNSLCHMIGDRPFRTRRHDRATDLWPLALLSSGESRHSLHHTDTEHPPPPPHGDRQELQ